MAVWDKFLSEDDAKLLARRGNIRKPAGLGESPALLVVDMQVAACGYDKPIHEQLDVYPSACGPYAWRAIAVQQKLLSAAREAGMLVVYSKNIFHPQTGLPKADASYIFSSLNKNSEIHEAVAMQEGDLLVEKQVPSCFGYTNLALLLRSKQIDSLLVVGNSTSGCVRATCLDAVAQGFKTQVVEEAVFDRIQMSHAASLFDMQFKICDVIDFNQAMRAIDGFAKRKPKLAFAS